MTRVIEIEPDIITVTGPETDIEGLEEISSGQRAIYPRSWGRKSIPSPSHWTLD